MDLVVFGANGPTGRLVVRQALVAGHHVIAVTRNPDQYPISSVSLDVVAADVTDAVAVERAVSGSQAVISTYGVSYSRRKITVYSHGVTNITQAMTRHGVGRLVCVSSTTVAGESAPSESFVWRKVVEPLLRNALGRTSYNDMERMEKIVEASSVEWTIVRPGGLFNADEPTDDYEVASRRLTGRTTSRADLAEVLVNEATSPQYPRSVVEVITRSATPKPLNFLHEIFGAKRS